MKDKNILVACNALDYVLIHKILSASFLLEKAEREGEIWQKLEEKEYDLILLDISFLEEDQQLIYRLKEKKNIPVIALSPEPSDARDHRLQKTGCEACYIKPLRHDTFRLFVRYWTDKTKE